MADRPATLPAWLPLAAGGLGCALALAVAAFVDGHVWRAWLAAAVLAFGIPLGALGLSMMTSLIPGAWRASLADPIAGVSALTAPAALLMLPVLAGAGLIYPWAHQHQSTAFRRAWLDPLSFGVRGVLLLVFFGGLAVLVRRRKTPAVPVAGLIAYTLATTVAAVDWLLSLDPAFASSGFGLYVLCLQMLSALAVSTILGARLRPPAPVDAVGAILLCGLLLWTYFAFMQYFIVWSGNLPPGVAWYQRRGDGLWSVLIWTAAALRLLPALLLLFPGFRTSRRALSGMAAAILAGSVLEVAWLALPGSGAAAGVAYPIALAAMTLLLVGAARLRPAQAEGAA